MRPSHALKMVLWVKIVATVILWIIPLFLPATLLQQVITPPPYPLVFMRLCGAAYTTLVFGYLQGVRDRANGKDITNVVQMGILSNGSACVILCWFAWQREWNAWSHLAQGLMWVSVIMTGAITLGLYLTGIKAGGARGKQG